MSNINPGKAIQRIFTLPSAPKTPDTPKVDDTAVQTAAVEAAKRRNRSRGYRSTILSQLLSGNESTAGGGQSPLRSTIGS